MMYDALHLIWCRFMSAQAESMKEKLAEAKALARQRAAMMDKVLHSTCVCGCPLEDHDHQGCKVCALDWAIAPGLKPFEEVCTGFVPNVGGPGSLTNT